MTAVGLPRACQHPYYPAVRVPLGFKAVTTLSFHVEPDGSVKDVVVTKSSGFDALDQAAAACAAQWQYKPAMQNGQPIEVSWHANVQWNLASRGRP